MKRFRAPNEHEAFGCRPDDCPHGDFRVDVEDEPAPSAHQPVRFVRFERAFLEGVSTARISTFAILTRRNSSDARCGS